jgi:hypothetical protein
MQAWWLPRLSWGSTACRTQADGNLFIDEGLSMGEY